MKANCYFAKNRINEGSHRIQRIEPKIVIQYIIDNGVLEGRCHPMRHYFSIKNILENYISRRTIVYTYGICTNMQFILALPYITLGFLYIFVINDYSFGKIDFWIWCNGSVRCLYLHMFMFLNECALDECVEEAQNWSLRKEVSWGFIARQRKLQRVAALVNMPEKLVISCLENGCGCDLRQDHGREGKQEGFLERENDVLENFHRGKVEESK